MSVVVSIKTAIKYNEEVVTGDLVQAYNHVKVTCDNSNCQRGSFSAELGRKEPKVIEWNEGKPEELPDDFFGILSLENTSGDKKAFCCKGCLTSYLLDYKPIKSPNLQNVIPFPSPADGTASNSTKGVFA